MKKFISVLLITAITCILGCTLIACDLLGDDGGNANSNNNGSGIKTEPKISFTEAEKNYLSAGDKKAVSTTNLEFGLYLKNMSSSASQAKAEKHTVSLTAETERIITDEASYAEIEIAPGNNISDSIVGLLEAVKKAFSEDNSSDIILGGMIGEETMSALREAARYIGYLQAFLQNRITLSAHVGKGDGVTNIKAEYVYKKTSTDIEQGEGWYSVTDEFIRKLLGLNVGSSEFIGGMYPAAFFDTDKGVDVASGRVDKNGIAQYDIQFEAQGVKNYINRACEAIAEEICGDNDDKKAALTTVANEIASWLSVEKSGTRFYATVGNNKLPSSTGAESVLVFNIDISGMRDMLNKLQRCGLMRESVTDVLNTAFFLLSSYACGTDGESGKLGFEVSFSAYETYSYSDKDCSVEDKDDDLFISGEEDPDGRVEIEDYFQILTETEMESYCKNVLSVLGDKADEIYDLVEIKLNGEEEITVFTLKNIIKEVLDNYLTDDAELAALIEKIKQELFSD